MFELLLVMVVVSFGVGYLLAIWRGRRALAKVQREADEARQRYRDFVDQQELISGICHTCKREFSDANPHYAGGVCRRCWSTSH